MQPLTPKEIRYLFLEEELNKVMPSVVTAIAMGFTPANYKLYENMAQEYYQLKKELEPTTKNQDKPSL